MEVTVELLRDLIKGCKADQEILDKLSAEGIEYSDDSEEYGYLNLHLDNDCRIYRDRDGEYQCQGWTRHAIRYSGVPTFNPSGVDNMKTVF